MKVRIAQLPVLKNMELNLANILRVIHNANQGEWILFPEGIVSGYYPEEDDFISKLNENEIEKNIKTISNIVAEKNLNCILSSALNYNESWYNSVIVMTPTHKNIYYKNNLSMLDRNHFQQGNELKPYSLNGVCYGIQMCREIVFPEQWRLLKQEGAQIIFHINNAIKAKDEKWEHLLITRALENQIWICSVNNATSPQALCSIIVNPFGEIVWKSVQQKEDQHVEEIDLSINSNVYQNQQRIDLVKVIRA